MGSLVTVRPQCIKVVGVGMVYNSTASPPDRRRVTPVGKVGSPPNSFLRLNLTCSIGFSSARKGGCTLLLDSQVLACSFKYHIWRHSHLLGRPELGRLGDDEEDCVPCYKLPIAQSIVNSPTNHPVCKCLIIKLSTQAVTMVTSHSYV